MTPQTFEQRLGEAAKRYWDNFYDIDKSLSNAFKSGALWGVEQVIDWLESDTMNGKCDDSWWEQNNHSGSDYASELKRVFLEGK